MENVINFIIHDLFFGSLVILTTIGVIFIFTVSVRLLWKSFTTSRNEIPDFCKGVFGILVAYVLTWAVKLFLWAMEVA